MLHLCAPTAPYTFVGASPTLPTLLSVRHNCSQRFCRCIMTATQRQKLSMCHDTHRVGKSACNAYAKVAVGSQPLLSWAHGASRWQRRRTAKAVVTPSRTQRLPWGRPHCFFCFCRHVTTRIASAKATASRTQRLPTRTSRVGSKINLRAKDFSTTNYDGGRALSCLSKPCFDAGSGLVTSLSVDICWSTLLRLPVN